ncbi:hypothetical protein B0H63DRAFT_488176 [Podospora didyma]|uniref:Uncharacterized protein n=1 Tax=Podospora didyma TaxID=330526 RepID=A0AAE0K2A5_9PEZI|nr:hypothetical protein B0H63DRAFT_488176 [Podospora didyma]
MSVHSASAMDTTPSRAPRYVQPEVGGDAYLLSQDLPGPRIRLDKLSAKLRTKFGPGTYKIYLIHDVYSIKVPARLSLTEIAECFW